MEMVFFALGTWGDFWPMYEFAREFGRQHSSAIVTVVSHEELEQQYLQAHGGRQVLLNVRCRWLPIPMHALIHDKQQQLNEFKLLQECCTDAVTECIVFNLCSIVAYHLAEWLGVRCLAFHAGANPPENLAFVACLQKRFPNLFERLSESEDGEQVTINEVNHWMSPIWSSVYTEWREKVLKLPSIPLMGRLKLPPAVPLIYALSPMLLQPPGYWPSSVHVVGQFHSECLASQHDALQNFFLECTKESRRPVYFGFGSMKPWENISHKSSESSKRLRTSDFQQDAKNSFFSGPDQDIFLVLKQCLLLLKRPGIFHNIPQSTQPCKADSRSDTFELNGFVDLSSVFPRCSVVVHHGGAGTVSQAVISQTTQVVCPIEFDQKFWANRVERLGLGSTSTLFKSYTHFDVTTAARELASLIERSTNCELQIMSVSEELRKENGIQESVRMLVKLLADKTFHHKSTSE